MDFAIQPHLKSFNTNIHMYIYNESMVFNSSNYGILTLSSNVAVGSAVALKKEQCRKWIGIATCMKVGSNVHTCMNTAWRLGENIRIILLQQYQSTPCKNSHQHSKHWCSLSQELLQLPSAEYERSRLKQGKKLRQIFTSMPNSYTSTSISKLRDQ